MPDWARPYRPRIGEKGENFAKRLLDKKYGEGKWKRGPGTEHNQIQKFGDSDFKTVIILPILEFIELKKQSEEYKEKLRKAKEALIERIEQRQKEIREIKIA